MAADQKRTREDCPGCGQNFGLRPIGVCEKCRAILDGFEELKARVESDPKRRVMLMPASNHWYDVFYEAITRLNQSSKSTAAENLRLAFMDVLKAVSTPLGEADRYNKVTLFSPTDEKLTPKCKEGLEKVLVPVQAVEPLRRLDLAIREALKEGWDNGYESGQSLLTGLATGSMSVQDFNEATVKRKGDR
jgi:hypothetical protein